MATLSLEDFIGGHREELISRCRAKVAARSFPRPTEEIDHGVPLFLDQLCQELRHGSSKALEIGESATEHGHDLLLRGFTISQVVHDYGDVCQSVTDLALELGAPISTNEFRTLNRCLDDAIASAVSEYAHGQDVSRYGESQQLQWLTDTALTAFEVLLTGRVGVGGSTGAVVLQNLLAIRAALASRPRDEGPTRQGDVDSLVSARSDREGQDI